MGPDRSPLVYPYNNAPAYGTTMEIAPGVRWLQMPLPMSLNHINLYLLEDDDGWTIVDTGIRGEETQQYWREIIANELGNKPVKGIICTHMHPDHTGQAGFLSDHCKAPLYMSYAEYYQARVMGSMMRESGGWHMSEYFERAGVSHDFLEKMREARNHFRQQEDDKPIPNSFVRLTDGDLLNFSGNEWQVITGNGHSPEHVCLYSKSLRILISGDQILPVITSNVSVQPTEPFADPMSGWLDSIDKFKQRIAHDTLILPAHNAPFYGVQERLDELREHHEDRMLVLEENCLEPAKAIDLLPFLFKRELTDHSLFMALGECIAHLHCLMKRQRIERQLVDGIYYYLSVDPGLKDRARPGHHEEPDEAPEMV